MTDATYAGESSDEDYDTAVERAGVIELPDSGEPDSEVSR